MLFINSAETLIWCGAVSAALASVFAFYSKNVVGKIVSALLKVKAFSPQDAKTLKELGCDTMLCRFALRKGSMQDGAVLSADGAYYIAEEKAEKMTAKFSKSEASAWVLVVVFAVAAIAAALLAAVYPTVARLLGIA
ncbi:MAG: hypothetical protein E7597_02460 [Ruminococcaceae bacterium]|nr:hypothetical protein [Oscillospiraceae bacterium]